MLNIISWNCHSLLPKLAYFKIKLYNKKPHIVCLCETWLKDNFVPTFINYTTYFLNRPSKQGGGIAILVRNDVPSLKKDIHLFQSGFLEVQAVTVLNLGSSIDILNIYNPNNIISLQEYEHYFSQLGGRSVIVGDFNAHNPMWDTNSSPNAAGNNLVDSLINFPEFCLLTPQNLPTYYHVPTRKHSTLDLCFVTSNLLSNSEVSLEADLGSDHTPTIIKINFVKK